MKKSDKYTHYRVGNIVRRITNINTPLYWDKYYSKYNTFYRDFPYKYLIEFLPKNINFSLLDIGCGLGDGCQLLKKYFPDSKIEGADFSLLAIKKARENKPGVNF